MALPIQKGSQAKTSEGNNANDPPKAVTRQTLINGRNHDLSDEFQSQTRRGTKRKPNASLSVGVNRQFEPNRAIRVMNANMDDQADHDLPTNEGAVVAQNCLGDNM
jgi:hypothetical protein